MKPTVVHTPLEMRALAQAWRAQRKRIAFVPTMGALHLGHVSLLEAARAAADVSVLSIFVNPTQFGPKEDLSRYPRTWDADLDKAERAGVEVVYAPDAKTMYPDGYQTFIEVRQAQRGLCGDVRPGHFVGVATVVLKLLHAVLPDIAIFGEKDYQQLTVLKRMAHDLDLGIEIRGMPLVRESDGLALSSRNTYLSAQERCDALVLSRALFAARDAFNGGELRSATLLRRAHQELSSVPRAEVEYLALRDAATLAEVGDALTRDAVLLVAARVGSTRLIDNVILRLATHA